MKIIFAGTIGRSGLGGQAWAGLQYLLGLRALGHEVFYLEDCGDTSYVWDWEKQEWNYGLDYPAGYVHDCLAPFGFENRWLYRTDAGSRGMPLPQLLELCAEADLLIARASPLWVWRPEYDRPRRRAFIDVDPGFTQIAIANDDKGLASGIARCERRFTTGQRIGAEICPIPTAGGPWLKTLPPVALSEWPCQLDAPSDDFTTIVRWQGFRDAKFQGASYGQRDKEFPKYLELPRLTQQKFRIALMGTPPEALEKQGWNVTPGEVISRTPDSYRQFIQQSRGEFSVPKHGYVEMQGGWFSDRSVCYLASGRPVIIENTGLDWLPCGEGLLTFSNLTEAAHCIEMVNADYPRHCRAARNLAEDIFSAEKVLNSFLQAAMN